MSVSSTIHQRHWPDPAALIVLIKPITWFPPMWAYACGVVSAGVWPSDWSLVVVGVLLAGPIVCGMSQAANDWCDRFVDAINEPDRPIPSGRVPGRWGLWVALTLSTIALIVGWQLGTWGFGATVAAVIAAWIYSAEPIRLKRSAWWGPGLVGLSYETLPWLTGVAVISQAAPRFEAVVVATLYGIGALGIMTLNDFKALEGDRATGVRSLPVISGPDVAARIACTSMVLPQTLVIAMLLVWGQPWHAAAIVVIVIAQCFAMRVLLNDPKGNAPWYNGTGVVLYVSGMMIAAFAIRSIGGL